MVVWLLLDCGPRAEPVKETAIGWVGNLCRSWESIVFCSSLLCSINLARAAPCSRNCMCGCGHPLQQQPQPQAQLRPQAQSQEATTATKSEPVAA